MLVRIISVFSQVKFINSDSLSFSLYNLSAESPNLPDPSKSREKAMSGPAENPPPSYAFIASEISFPGIA